PRSCSAGSASWGVPEKSGVPAHAGLPHEQRQEGRATQEDAVRQLRLPSVAAEQHHPDSVDRPRARAEEQGEQEEPRAEPGADDTSACTTNGGVGPCFANRRAKSRAVAVSTRG